jgi:hypothetical protein
MLDSFPRKARFVFQATILWKILKKGELQQSTERALKLIRAILALSYQISLRRLFL